MEKLSRVLIVIFLLSILYFLYSFRDETLTVSPHIENTPTVLRNTNDTNNSEADAIRNRPFPLAGMDNGAYSEGDTIEPLNKEPVDKNYLIGPDPLTTDNGMKITTTLYEVGNITPKDYYGGFDNPSIANGRYVEIRYSIENTNKKPTTLNISNVRLLTNSGYEYFPTKRLIVECERSYETYTKVDELSSKMNPGSICTGKLLFDIATSTMPVHLKINLY